MTKQESIEVIDAALKYLGWQGGTVWQIEMELYKRTGVVRTTTIHLYIKDMLIELGVVK